MVCQAESKQCKSSVFSGFCFLKSLSPFNLGSFVREREHSSEKEQKNKVVFSS